MYSPRHQTMAVPTAAIPTAAVRSKNVRTRVLGSLALSLLLVGCAGKAPSGYGLMGSQSTAAQAQEQLAAAEQANQPDTVQTYLDLITQMQQAGQWYASLAHADAFEKQHGARPESTLLRADALRNTGQLEAAQRDYQSLLETSSKGRALRGLGLLYASQGQYGEAIAQLEQARQLNPIDASLLSDIAYAQMLDGNLPAARVPALQAAQLAPGNARVQLNLALYWLANGQQDDAQRLLQRLSQPQAKGAAPLIDQQSTQMLRSQLDQVLQAAQERSANPASSPQAKTSTVVLFEVPGAQASAPEPHDAVNTNPVTAAAQPNTFEN